MLIPTPVPTFTAFPGGGEPEMPPRPTTFDAALSASPLRRVFIVDDNDLFTEFLVEFLEMEPNLIVVGKAASGEEALGSLATLACEVALVDVSMPGMSGIELVRRLQDVRPDLPCLMLSAHIGASYVEEALSAGARGFVEKGSPAELLEAIEAVAAGAARVVPREGRGR